MEISVCSALFLYYLFIFRTDTQLYAVPGIIPLCLFLLYLLIQIMPLPSLIVKMISPASYLLQEASSNMTISIHPRATLLEFFRYSTYVLFYVFAVQILSDKNLLKKSIFIITVFGAILAFSSILQFYLTDLALWFRHAPEKATIMGPYINRNHYAGLMEMIFPVALALFLFHKPRTDDSSFFQGIVEIFKQEKANIHILIGTGTLLIVTSIFVSLSRGGMISICIGLLLFLGLSFKKKASQKSSILIISIVIIAGFSISWFGWGTISDRFAKVKTSDGATDIGGRLEPWEDSKKIIRDFTVTGSGFGTFKDIYPSVQTIDGKSDLQHAHNDYIELMTEGGAIGFLLVFSFLATLFYKTYKSFILRKDAYSIYIYIGSITGMISILIHSFSDFNMHVGANGLWFALLAALAVSASNTRLRVKNIATNLLPVKSTRIKHTSFAIVSTLFLIITISNISILIASFYYSNIRNSNMGFKTPALELKKIKKIINYAAFFDPLNSEYIHASANVSWFLHDNKEAKEYYLKSIRLNPANGHHVKRYGLFLTQTNEITEAEKILKRSVMLDISSADNAFQYGGLLLATGQKAKGVKYLKKAISLDKDIISSVLTTMSASDLSLEEMEQAIPNNPETAIIFTDFLDQIGETEKAEIRYLNILDSLSTSENVKGKHIYKIFNFFIAHNNLFQAMEVLKKGEIILPSDTSIRIKLGDLYQKQGILFKAKGKYEEALLLDPKNRSAKIRLDRLNQ